MPEELGYASWGSRVVAQIIDDVVVGIATIVVWTQAGWAAGAVVGLLGGFAYFTICHARWGQTIGKRARGINVRLVDGRPLRLWQSVGRSCAQFAFGIVPLVALLNALWPLWDRRNQAWHDKVAGTVVVRTAAAPACGADARGAAADREALGGFPHGL